MIRPPTPATRHPEGASTISGTGKQHARVLMMLTIAALVAGVLLRIVLLDSDPRYTLWSGYVTDEGRWIEQARSMALFGTMDLDSPLPRMHLLLAPAYQAASYLCFLLFGVGFTTARLVSSVSGILVILLAFFVLRRHLSRTSLALCVFLLAVHPELVFLSRVAIPEMAAMLFELTAFLLLVSAPRSEKKALLAGLATAAGMTVKATIAPIIPIFVAVTFFAPVEDDPSGRRKRILAFLAGLAAPALAGVLVLFAFADSPLPGAVETIRGFLQVDSLYAIATFLVENPFVRVLNIPLLAAWSLAGILLGVGRLPDRNGAAVYIGSAIWTVGWLGTAAVLAYFPQRYVFHVLVPLIISIAAGLSQLETLGLRKLSEALGTLGVARRRWVALWLSLPLALLLVPPLAAAAEPAGFTIDRIREKTALVILLSSGVSWLAGRSRDPGRFLGALTAVPLLMVVLWSLFGEVAAAVGLETVEGTVEWAGWILCGTIVVGATVLMRRAREPGRLIDRSIYAYFAAFAALWIIGTAPVFLQPTYTIAGTSEDLGRLVPRSTVVSTEQGASLFLENRLRYDEGDVEDHSVLVTAFDNADPEVLEGFREVKRYELALGYHGFEGRFAPIVRLYARGDSIGAIR